VSRCWNAIASDPRLKQPFLDADLKKLDVRCCYIGKEAWYCLGDIIDEVPPLPDDILEILNSPCPWTAEKKVKETHILALIPKDLTLNSIGELVKEPKKGQKIKYHPLYDLIEEEYGNTAETESYWALMTKDVLNGSRCKTRSKQLALAKEKDGYKAPNLRQAIFINFMLFVSKEISLFGWKKFTCCREKPEGKRLLAVGGFRSGGFRYSGLVVVENDDYGSNRSIGVAAVRKL